MKVRRAVAVATSLGGFAAAALMASAAPAQASQPALDCSGGPSIDCFLPYGGTNEVWYINGSHYTAGDNQDSIYTRCSRGTTVEVYVTYTGGDGWGSAGASFYCGF